MAGRSILESDNSGRIARAPNAVSTMVDGALLVMDANTGKNFGLDDVGGAIWDLLREPSFPAVIQQKLIAEFDGDADLIAREAALFIDKLGENGLVTTC